MKVKHATILGALCVLATVAADAPLLLEYRFDVPAPVRYHAEYAGEGTYARHTGPGFSPRPVSTRLRALFESRGRRVAPTDADRARAHGGAVLPSFELELAPLAFNHVLTTDAEVSRVVVGPGVLKVTRNDKPVFDLGDQKMAAAGRSREFSMLREPIRLRLDARGRQIDRSGIDRLRLLLPQLALDELLRFSLVRLPADAVSPGESWTAEYPLTLPHCPRSGCRMEIAHRFVKRVVDRGYDCARIQVDGTADLAQGDFTHGGGVDIVSGSDTRYTFYYQHITGEVDFAVSEGIVVSSTLHVETSYNAVFAYVESGIDPSEVRVDLELAVDSEFRLDGEKPPEGAWERVKRWIDRTFWR